MRAFKNILFCTDFSDHADFAFDFALGLAASAPGATLHVLHVLPEPAAQFWRGYVSEVDNIDEMTRAELNARFAPYEARANGAALRAAVRFGRPGEEILAYAKAEAADVVVLGHRAHGSLFSGNAVAQVVKHAECPVLVIPLNYRQRATGGA